MADVLTSPVLKDHARAMLGLELDELKRLRVLHEQARIELIGRLADLPGDKFAAQQVRGALAQVALALRAMNERLHAAHASRLDGILEQSIDQVLEEIAFFERKFRGAVRRVQTDALRRLASPRGLLLQQFDQSIAAYGATALGDLQRRMGVHALKKSSVRDMAIDVAGRLKKHGMQGLRWKAERIVRTELVNALAEGAQVALEASAEFLPDLKRQWDATLDARTSELCQTLNGQVRKLDEPWVHQRRLIARPPGHPNCRARALAWRDEWAQG